MQMRCSLKRKEGFIISMPLFFHINNKNFIYMKHFIFIFGKNPELSLAEIVCYFRSLNMKFSIKEFSDNFAIIETVKLPKNILENLGGTIKIGEVLFSSEIRSLENIKNNLRKILDFNTMFKNLTNKILFGISYYGSLKNYFFLSKLFKQEMKLRGIKAGCIHLSKNRHELTHTEIIKKRVLERSLEFLVCNTNKNFYLGKTLLVHNPFEFRKRDIERPVQRPIFSISPRLCKIMINLTCLRKGILLDPFCGIGSILQEAMLMGFDIRGIDINKECITGCRRNLIWLKEEYNIKIKIDSLKEKIKIGDVRKLSRYFSSNSIDVIVTEPILGPPLKKRPNFNKAQKIIKHLFPFYKVSLKEMFKILKENGTIVIVSPAFKTERGLVRIEIEKIINNLGGKIIDPLKLYNIKHTFPFFDYEKRHKTLREITIIKKF